MYGIVIWYSYALQNDHHDESNYHLSAYKVIIKVIIIYIPCAIH